LKSGVVPTDSEETAFKDVDVALFVGAMPRKEGMERKDLLNANVKIFKSQGTALDKFAKKTVKVNILFFETRYLKLFILRFLLLVIQRIQIVIFWHIMLNQFHVKTLLV
jgi:hypothetical protein